jgi:glyoxylase-like metal-dependent hydrolase (beta-lactamase superfamily II)
MTCNCLLARNEKHVVLIDTGYGGKYPPLDRKSYKMEEGNPLLESLKRNGILPEDVHYVLFTHLHFDHVGGATIKDRTGSIVPVFSQACYLAHRWEWEDAVSRQRELSAAYPQEHLIPFEKAGTMKTFDNDSEILPGLKAIRTGGHTRGHCAFLFESAKGDDGALFIGDICPTRAHLKTLWNMSYDNFLLETRRKKRQMLETVSERNWWLFLPHDPFVPACRIKKVPGREFVTTETLFPSIGRE